jgi:hypothetical protein
MPPIIYAYVPPPPPPSQTFQVLSGFVEPLPLCQATPARFFQATCALCQASPACVQTYPANFSASSALCPFVSFSFQPLLLILAVYISPVSLFMAVNCHWQVNSVTNINLPSHKMNTNLKINVCISVNWNTKPSLLNMKKNCFSKFLPFITGVVDTGD